LNRLRGIVEIIGILAVGVSLIVLIIEVRENTLTMERQAAIDRVEALTAPFFQTDLAKVAAKIAQQKGVYPLLTAFMKEYDLTLEEAILWERHLWYLWEVLEAEYIAEGESEELENQIRILLINSDNAQYVESTKTFRFSKQFRVYLVRLQTGQEEFERGLRR